MTNADKVKIMMLRFNQEVKVKPAIPDSRIVALRARIIQEECTEVLDAIEEGDIKHIAKELCDLLVVTYGALHAYGICPDEAFELVHNSNMSKLGDDGKPELRADGKVLKGSNYVEPDMEFIMWLSNM